MMDDLLSGGALPVLQRLVQFTEARQRVLVDDIANVSTPYFKPRDLSTASFQATLRQAIDRRRQSANPAGPLDVQDTRELRFGKNGIETSPNRDNQGILFHDQNNRDLERLMQHLAENTMAHRTGLELLRSEIAVINVAIRERL
ncbi:MAG: flagellar basal body rod protein FlgB [Phycisphaeraceae bacterium]